MYTREGLCVLLLSLNPAVPEVANAADKTLAIDDSNWDQAQLTQTGHIINDNEILGGKDANAMGWNLTIGSQSNPFTKSSYQIIGGYDSGNNAANNNTVTIENANTVIHSVTGGNIYYI